MIRIVLSIALLLTVVSFPFAQNCTPDSPITLSSLELSKDKIVNVINQTRPRFSEADLSQVIWQIGQCNQQLEIELQDIENQISGYSLKAQELYRFKDVNSILNRIETLYHSLEESKNELRKNLKQTAQVGVFAVLLKNIDIYADKNHFIHQAKEALSPVVVETLNGVNINRMTKVAEYEAVSDIIESFVSGEMVIKKRFLDQANYDKGYFLYVVQVSVSPLEEKRLSTESTIFYSDATIVQLDDNSIFLNQLTSKGVTDKDLEAIKTSAVPYIKLSHDENKNALRRQENILAKGKSEIRKINQDIQQAQEDLRGRENKIRKFCEENGLPFSASEIDGSAKRALDYFQDEIMRLDQAWFSLKANEIIHKPTTVTIQGAPAESFAEESLRLHRSLNEESGTISKTTEKVRIEDFEVTDYDARKTIEIYRSVERIWVYPIPQENGAFEVTVFAKFQITGQGQKAIVNHDYGRTNKAGSSSNINYFSVGQKAFEDKRYADALRAYLRDIELKQTPISYGNAGLCYRLLEQPKKAVEYYKKYLELKPNHPWTIRGLASAYSEMKDYRSAYTYAKKATELDSENYSSWFNLSFYALFMDKPYEVIHAAQKTLKLNSSAIDVETNLALGYLLSDDWLKAKRIYQKWKGRSFPDDDRTCDEIFLQDIADLEAAGVWHSDFSKVKIMFSK